MRGPREGTYCRDSGQKEDSGEGGGQCGAEEQDMQSLYPDAVGAAPSLA